MAENAVAERLSEVRERIHTACGQYGRDPADVHLLAVSKTKPAELVAEAMEAGQTHFGENYLQEALDKVSAVPGAIWHFIGAIQSNKTRAIAEYFDWVHTVASVKVARRLADQRPDDLPPLKVLVQVNVSGEASKAGIDPAGLAALIDGILSFERLELRGLMAIPEPQTDFERQRESFRTLRELRDEMTRQFGGDLAAFTDLSMGMTDDMVAAIAEGATWLRIGTAIFGARN